MELLEQLQVPSDAEGWKVVVGVHVKADAWGRFGVLMVVFLEQLQVPSDAGGWKLVVGNELADCHLQSLCTILVRVL